MTDRMIENRLRKLQALEAQIAEIEKEAEAVRAELKADLEAKGQEEITTAHGLIVRWKTIISSRFDSAAFRKAHGDLYKAFQIPSESHRFTYSA